MFKNYLKINYKNLLKYKVFSFINIFGLSIGIASFILIFLYVNNEMNYDTFHKDYKKIYQIYQVVKIPEGEAKFPETPDPLPVALKNDYPEIGSIARLFYSESGVSVNHNSFKEKIYFTDPSFFEIFNFPFEKGDSKTALENINSIVITREYADKYFGSEEPLGKLISIQNRDLVVTGVLKNLPSNTSMQFNILLPAKLNNLLDPDFEKRWWSSGTCTFVKFSEIFTPEMLQKQFPFIISKYFPDFLKDREKFDMLPLSDIHLQSDIQNKIVPSRSKTYLYVLFLLALSILVIVGINFTNLSITRYSERLKEIGVRKTLGAERKHLVSQFMSDSVFFSLISMLLGIGLVELLLPGFNSLSGKKIFINYTENIFTIPYLIGFGIAFGIIIGIYPAIFLSSAEPINIIRGKKTGAIRKNNMTKCLVVLQFSISVLLITVELVMLRQISFMKNKDLGFDPENIVILPVNKDGIINADSKYVAYLNSLQALKENQIIKSFSVSENVPGYFYQNKFGVLPEGSQDKKPMEMMVTSIDDKFLETYKMEIKEGRNISSDFGTDLYSSVLINETAAKRFDGESALNKTFNYKHGEGPFRIIGIVKDINFKSLQNTIEPLIYRYVSNYNRNYISLKINTQDVQSNINILKNEWNKIFPDAVFQYSFLFDEFSKNYKEEETTSMIMGYFTIIAIILACLGLFGLTAVTVTRRTKEIGIRKVLGSSTLKLLILLSKEFALWILIANIFAWPFSYYLINKWLQDFAYKINVSIWIFVLSGLVTVIISFLTIMFRILKTVRANPIEALKYE
jgi:putative ABC transport system permease protein